MAYKQIQSGGNFIKWDVPKRVEGTLIGFQPGEYKGKATTSAILKQADGVVVKVGVSATISMLSSFPAGVKVLLNFKGKATGKSGQTFNDIEMFIDEGDVPTMQPVPLVQHPAPSPAVVAGTPPTVVQQPTSAPASEVPAASEYDILSAKLRIHNPKGADSTLNAFQLLYAEPGERTKKLREHLTQQGVA